jgi:ABC-type lipoprotein release transport system permease subunit
VDAETARSLDGYIIGSGGQTADGAQAAGSSGSVDDLFSSGAGAGDTAAVGGSLDLASVEKALGKNGARATAVRTNLGAWNFILVRAEDNRSLPRLRSAIEKAIASGGYEARVLDWRGTAGSQAQMVYFLRIVFNIGIVILAFAAIVIIMNSLVISVLERAGEIGMMRAIGASRAYVCALFVAETMSVTLSGAVAGLALGWAAIMLLSSAGIRLTNPLLVTLFGGSVIRPSIGFLDALSYLAAALLAGAVAWIYPVRLVLASQPVQAMAKADE